MHVDPDSKARNLPEEIQHLYEEEPVVVEESGPNKVVRDGLLDRICYDNRDASTHVRIVACPACGHVFDAVEVEYDRIDHFESHSPEDFGLSPMGQRSGTEECDQDQRGGTDDRTESAESLPLTPKMIGE